MQVQPCKTPAPATGRRRLPSLYLSLPACLPLSPLSSRFLPRSLIATRHPHVAYRANSCLLSSPGRYAWEAVRGVLLLSRTAALVRAPTLVALAPARSTDSD